MILKRFASISLCLMSLYGAYGQSGKSAFEAGVARRIITPDPLLPVSGGMGRRRPPNPSKAS
jgi:hypothetical protein